MFIWKTYMMEMKKEHNILREFWFIRAQLQYLHMMWWVRYKWKNRFSHNLPFNFQMSIYPSKTKAFGTVVPGKNFVVFACSDWSEVMILHRTTFIDFFHHRYPKYIFILWKGKRIRWWHEWKFILSYDEERCVYYFLLYSCVFLCTFHVKVFL